MKRKLIALSQGSMKLLLRERDRVAMCGLSVQMSEYSVGLAPFFYKMKRLGISIRDVFDVGAHDGSWTRSTKRLLPRSCRFVLFEPNDSHNDYLKTTNEPYFNVLLSDSVRKVPWFGIGSLGDSYYREVGSTFASLSPRMRETTTLNLLVKQHALNVPNLLKVDTQGSELDIIRGSSDFISDVSIVLLECPLVEYNSGAPNIHDYLTEMSAWGFTPVDITEVHRMNGVAVQIDIAFKNLRI